MVTSLGKNWNTFFEELERFDAGFRDLLPEPDSAGKYPGRVT